jgi:MFS family permease
VSGTFSTLRRLRYSTAVPDSKHPARWLNRTVLAIGLASLFSDVGHEMATAAMPALLVSLGGTSATLGLVEGAADGVAVFAKLASGRWSDRLPRRKPLAIVGYLLTALGMGSFAIATSRADVLVGRAVGWLGRGVRSPVRKVLLAEATTPETYGRAFGLERAMDSAGAVVGPLVALLAAAAVGARGVFALTLVPSVLAVFAMTFLVRESPHVAKATGSFLAGFSSLPPPFRRFLVGVGVAGLGDFSSTLLILWAAQGMTPAYGAAHASALSMGLYVGYNAVYTASCAWSGRLADRFPKGNVLAVGYALASVPAALLVWPSVAFAKYALVFATSGLYMGFWETVESATAATYLPAESRGAGFGLMDAVNGVADVLSSIVVGVLWTVAPSAAMGFVIAASLFGASLVWRSGRAAMATAA